ncbi:MAG: hypothetical protein COZ06_18325 [Armatimonadetes bacterium CG_4_10_14_3_um_filter_66_18]|nr:hypothetical protein [Armatimonadota bacterium]OIP09370.1 MAG: hypothetical protein AUJ96_05265 [Armatimonadetes bacterium CG2_30_66_41]PIU92007.1 MAG: hypothetical protein COS65_20075 [Armatimonadetes bacterium CG06_land_8_20_14_3_00_66_21]PIX43371.1 MAG: hypothetical protein COZ57_19390 [Armatimonadetes bacterium CG_4_8_14_3_um_filter_66_20]PIY46689.1 MAG: hypothetical protein COZ06_18325 [Armatimonadetes bacterium CG_4_10_14_3_um_filter_66_18]PIZ32201.1 MAG: hypothetical protein COY42_31
MTAIAVVTNRKTYYADVDWKDAHLAELTEKYPNHWVAVSEGRVVAAHPALGRAKREAARNTGRDEKGISAFYIFGLDMVL